MNPLGAILLCGIGIAAAQSNWPEVVRLARIKQHMKGRLEQVPNYTCLETVERSERAKPSAKFKAIDTIRIEVAEVSGRELFALPGQPFKQSDPGAFTHGGAMASGLFAQFADALFVNDITTAFYAGEEKVADRKLLRYDFHVPLLRSDYAVQTPYSRVVVAYHGSFWADKESLDVLHLRIVAENVRPALGLLVVGIDIEFQKVRVGATEALLPQSADMLLTELSGAQRRNITRFSGCRQYESDSVVSFETQDSAKPNR